MAKIIAWLVLIFVVLLALRVIARRKAGTAGDAARATGSRLSSEPMVRCVRCGVFVPRAEAKETRGGYVCATEGCVAHG